MDRLSHQLIRNSLSNGLKLAVSIVSGLLLPPIVIRFIGIRDYGLWTLIVAISQLIYIVDFGLQPALAKFVAELRANGSHDDIPTMIAGALTIYGIGAGLVLTVYFAGRDVVVPFMFKAAPSQVAGLTLLVSVMLAITIVTQAAGVLIAILNGLQRMDIANYVTAAAAAANAVVTLVLLIGGARVWALVAASGASTAVTALGCFVAVVHYAPDVRFRSGGWKISGRSIRRLLFLSSSDGTNRLIGTALNSGTRFLLGAYAGLASVAYFDLASRFVSQLTMLAWMIFTPLVAAVSELDAANAYEQIRVVTARTLRYLNILALPLFVFAVWLAPLIVHAWLGPGFEPVARAIQIMAIASYASVLGGPSYHSLIGMGKPVLGIQTGLINFVLNLALTVVFTVKWHFIGAVVGQSLALGISSAYFFVRSNAEIGLAFSRVRETVLVPWAGVLAVSPLLWVMSRTAVAVRVSGQIVTWFAVYAVFAAGCYWLFWQSGVIRKSDFDLIRAAYTRRALQ